MTTKRPLVIVWAEVACLLFLHYAGASTVAFQGLGDLPGGDYRSEAWDISADGRVVVGYSRASNNVEAAYSATFKWTKSDGMMEIASPISTNSPLENEGKGVSADGSIIVGFENPSEGAEAYRWSEIEGKVGLGDFPGGDFFSYAHGVSADGDTIVGESTYSDNFATGSREAFRWTPAGGMEGLGFLAGGRSDSYAIAVSADASVIVGHAYTAGGKEAFRWTQATGCVGLGHLAGDTKSEAKGISSDGSTIVGLSKGAIQEAIRWTASEGMVGLGDLPGGINNSIAEDASADGSIIVGYSTSSRGIEPFIWDQDNGMRSLNDVLELEHNVDLTGWELKHGIAVSDNGKIIVGFGTNPDGNTEGWIAWLEIDDDQDGIKDDWEIEHFGSITNCVPTDDPDGDRYTNYEEYINDTLPHQFDIGPAMLWTAVEVGWMSVDGTNYQIQCTTDLTSSNWVDEGGIVVGNGSIKTKIFSTRTNETPRYFRIILAP